MSGPDRELVVLWRHKHGQHGHWLREGFGDRPYEELVTMQAIIARDLRREGKRVAIVDAPVDDIVAILAERRLGRSPGEVASAVAIWTARQDPHEAEIHTTVKSICAPERWSALGIESDSHAIDLLVDLSFELDDELSVDLGCAEGRKRRRLAQEWAAVHADLRCVVTVEEWSTRRQAQTAELAE